MTRNLRLLPLAFMLAVGACSSGRPVLTEHESIARRASPDASDLYTVEQPRETLSELLGEDGALVIGRHIAIDCSGQPAVARNVCAR